MTRILAWMLVVLTMGVSSAAGAVESDPFKGLKLAAALGRLQQQGLRIVFSSDLVRPDMVVSEEPHGRWPGEILDDLLSRHGLRSQSGPAGTLLVVKAPPGAVTPVPKRMARRTSTVAPGHFEDVVVNGRSAASERSRPDSREFLAGGDLARAPDHAGDPLLSAGRLPGVAIDTAMGGLNVRGSAARETKIVLDGLELYEPYHLKDLGGPISLLDSRAIGGVEVLSAAFTAEYGGHAGGIVQIDTLDPSVDSRGEAAFASDGARVATQGLVGRSLGWVGSVRQGNGTRFLNSLGADPGYRPSYWDAFVKADYRPDDKTSLSFHVLGGDDEAEGTASDDLITTVQQAGTFKSRHTNRYGWATARRTLTPGLFSQLMISNGHFTIDRSGSSPRLAAMRDARAVGVLGIKNDWLFQSTRHLVKWGFDFKHAQADYQYGSLRRSVRGNDVGVYAADRWRLSSKLNVELGLRLDTQTYVPGGRAAFGPRVNAVYAIGQRTALRLGWGRFAQSQKIHELQIEDGVTEFVPAERVENSGISIAHEFTSGFHAQLSGYRKRMSGLQPRYENLFSPISFFPEAELDRVKVAPDAARADGVELTVRSPAGRPVNWWAGYGLARVDDRLDGSWVPRAWDQRHTLNAGFDWKPAPAWVLAVAGTFHTGRPTTPLVVEGFGERNSLRLDAYSRLDVRLSRSIHIRGALLDAAVIVTDVFDRQGGIERRYRQGLPRLITAGVTWKF